MKRIFAYAVSLVFRSLNRLGLRRAAAQAPKAQTQRKIALHERDIVAISRDIDGWLNPPATLATIHLLSILPEGPIMEIGVFRGKYLAVLRACVGAARRIVGYDIFTAQQQGSIRRDFEAAFGEDSNLALITIDSTKLTPQAVMRDCADAPVFVSVDGSHEAGPVLSDLKLTEAVLAPEGIVAVDDAFNPLAIGVSEGLGRYLMSEPDLTPFLYVANKLFLCREAQYETYFASAIAFLDGRGEDPSFPTYRKLKAGGDGVTRLFYGAKVIIAA